MIGVTAVVVTDAGGYFVIELPVVSADTSLDLIAVGALTTWPAPLSVELELRLVTS